MQNPYYFMYATLIDPDTEKPLHLLSDGKTRSTSGTLVASLSFLKDLDNTDAAFFVFPDISVRLEGTYKLKFTLFEMVGARVFACATATSDTFVVYSAKKFPGMQESTLLSCALADQGLKIRIRKDHRTKRVLKRRGSSRIPLAASGPMMPFGGYHQHPPPPGYDGSVKRHRSNSFEHAPPLMHNYYHDASPPHSYPPPPQHYYGNGPSPYTTPNGYNDPQHGYFYPQPPLQPPPQPQPNTWEHAAMTLPPIRSLASLRTHSFAPPPLAMPISSSPPTQEMTLPPLNLKDAPTVQ
jgi:hypothetical protein